MAETAEIEIAGKKIPMKTAALVVGGLLGAFALLRGQQGTVAETDSGVVAEETAQGFADLTDYVDSAIQSILDLLAGNQVTTTPKITPSTKSGVSVSDRSGKKQEGLTVLSTATTSGIVGSVQLSTEKAMSKTDNGSRLASGSAVTPLVVFNPVKAAGVANVGKTVDNNVGKAATTGALVGAGKIVTGASLAGALVGAGKPVTTTSTLSTKVTGQKYGMQDPE